MPWGRGMAEVVVRECYEVAPIRTTKEQRCLLSQFYRTLLHQFVVVVIASRTSGQVCLQYMSMIYRIS